MPFCLELQSRFAGCVGKGLNAAMVQITATIEYYFRDAFFFGALSDGFADQLCAFHVAALTPQRFLSGRGSSQGVALRIVDNLGIDVIDTAEHGEARTLLSAGHTAANPFVNTRADICSRIACHYVLAPAPVFPAFLRSTSPV